MFFEAFFQGEFLELMRISSTAKASANQTVAANTACLPHKESGIY